MKVLKIKLVLSIIVFLGTTSVAQNLSDEWTNIHNDEFSSLFIEPSKIVEYGNEISVWTIEKLKESKITESNDRIKTIKTHYLFNKIKKRYAEIGIIFYNEKGGIVNRSSKSNLNSGPSAFMTPISSNSKTEIIYKEVISYLITGEIRDVDSEQLYVDESSIKTQSAKNETEKLSDVKNSNKTVISPPTPTIIVINEGSVDSITSESISEEDAKWNDIPKIKAEGNIVNKPTLNLSDTKSVDKNSVDEIDIKIPENNYNTKNEKALKNAIFTDGHLFCFQVSSWKTKRYADRELKKLLNKDYNAFIVSVKPKNKKDIWHRVRIGYFDSLEETQRVQRSVKRIR